MAYEVFELKDIDEDSSWDAEDWCWMVMQGDDTTCICATQAEADHIAKLLNVEPYVASAVTG